MTIHELEKAQRSSEIRPDCRIDEPFINVDEEPTPAGKDYISREAKVNVQQPCLLPSYKTSRQNFNFDEETRSILSKKSSLKKMVSVRRLPD